MTIALKIGDEGSAVRGLIYFDVVTSFSENVSGAVSSFPLDAGVSVADHYAAKNPSYQVRGILSAMDVSGASSRFTANGESPVNSKPTPPTPNIVDFAVGVAKFLPGSNTQTYKTVVPTITGGSVTSKRGEDQVKEILRNVMTGVQYSSTLKRYQNNMTLITLYEVDNGQIKQEHKDLVLTSFVVEEDADSGEAVTLSLTLEKVRFAVTEKVSVKQQKNTKKSVKKGVKTPQVKTSKEANDTTYLDLLTHQSLPEDPRAGPTGSFNSKVRGTK